MCLKRGLDGADSLFAGIRDWAVWLGIVGDSLALLNVLFLLVVRAVPCSIQNLLLQEHQKRFNHVINRLWCTLNLVNGLLLGCEIQLLPSIGQELSGLP